MPQAIECLRRASILEPSRAEYAVQYAKALTLANHNREAKVAADRAALLPSSDPLTLDTLGVIYSQIGSYASAIEIFRKAVASSPRHAPYRYNMATSMVAAGAIEAAETEIEICLSLDPHYWRAHLTLAQLRRQTIEHNHVERLTSLLSSVDAKPADPAAQICLNLALSKEYEDLTDYPKALSHLVRGKSAAGTGRSYSNQSDEALFSAITAACPKYADSVEGSPTDKPIFVIGMPRSGTTLVERIISSHPDVYSAGELLNFPMLLKQLSKSQSPVLIDAEVISGAADIDWKQLGEMYLSSTQPATDDKPHFVDKFPHNFLYAGFITRALPNAKIICLRRNPMDSCLSNFRQLFAPNSPFFDYSFDLIDTGRYYVLFDRLMKHWQRTMPGRILEVSYEALINDQETQSRGIIEFCRLSWDERCMRFEQNASPVATASAVQVRSPIYRSALDRWKKYGAQLDKLQELLTTAGIAV